MPYSQTHPDLRIPLLSEAGRWIIALLLVACTVIVLAEFVTVIVDVALHGSADANIVWKVLGWLSTLGKLVLAAMWITWAVMLFRGRFIEIETVAPGSLRFVLPWREHRLTGAQVSSVTTSHMFGFHWVTIRAIDNVRTFRFTVSPTYPDSADEVAEYLKAEFGAP